MFAVKEHHVDVIEMLLSSCNPLECEQLCVPQNQVSLLVMVWWIRLPGLIISTESHEWSISGCSKW